MRKKDKNKQKEAEKNYFQHTHYICLTTSNFVKLVLFWNFIFSNLQTSNIYTDRNLRFYEAGLGVSAFLTVFTLALPAVYIYFWILVNNFRKDIVKMSLQDQTRLVQTQDVQAIFLQNFFAVISLTCKSIFESQYRSISVYSFFHSVQLTAKKLSKIWKTNHLLPSYYWNV